MGRPKLYFVRYLQEATWWHVFHWIFCHSSIAPTFLFAHLWVTDLSPESEWLAVTVTLTAESLPGLYSRVRRVHSWVDNLTKTVLTYAHNIYISLLCYDVSVRLSVTEVHWRIIANLCLKFRSHFTAHCGRRTARRAACVRIISRHASQC